MPESYNICDGPSRSWDLIILILYTLRLFDFINLDQTIVSSNLEKRAFDYNRNNLPLHAMAPGLAAVK